MRIVFQILLLAFVVVGVLMMFRNAGGQRNQALRRLMSIAFVLLAAASILFPELLTAVARLVGIGRGTDLVLYVFIVVFIWFTATSHRRFRAIEATQTQIIRMLALRDAPEAAEEGRRLTEVPGPRNRSGD